MNEIEIFKNPLFGEIRTTLSASNEPLFCASDVCKALGYANGRDAVINHTFPEDVEKLDTLTKGGLQKLSYINEGGLYSLILGSKLETAKQFKKWVTSEVLPSIRKTGGYNIASYQITDPIKRAQKWIEEEKQRQLLIEDNDKKEAQIKEDAPKVLFANCITGSKSSCLIGELAKILTVNGYKIGQNRLFEKLRKEHYLGTRGESYNIPNQQYVEQGLFDIRKRPQFVNGVSFVTTTIKVTGKGQQYFINKFIGALQPSLNM